MTMTTTSIPGPQTLDVPKGCRDDDDDRRRRRRHRPPSFRVLPSSFARRSLIRRRSHPTKLVYVYNPTVDVSGWSFGVLFGFCSVLSFVSVVICSVP